MAMFSAYKKKHILKAAVKQTSKARKNEGPKADQLFISAYEGYATVVKDNLVLADALYNWGFALLHEAKTKQGELSITLYLDSIEKFKFCLLVEPNHLGSAIDGGVAYMDLARNKKVDVHHELYKLAKQSFENAERIQKGSAAYNLACINGLRGDQEGCLETLELSKKFGSLPEAEEIENDADLVLIKDLQWFKNFMERLAVEPEPEVVDEDAPVYDEEGKIVKEKKHDLRKNPETIVNGVVYDVEGNIIKKVDPEEEAKAKLKKKKRKVKKVIEGDNSKETVQIQQVSQSDNQHSVEQNNEEVQPVENTQDTATK